VLCLRGLRVGYVVVCCAFPASGGNVCIDEVLVRFE